MAMPGTNSPSAMISEDRPMVLRISWSRAAIAKARTPTTTVARRPASTGLRRASGLACWKTSRASESAPVLTAVSIVERTAAPIPWKCA